MKRYSLTVEGRPDPAPGFNHIESALQRARVLFRSGASAVVVWEWETRRVAALYRG